MKKIAALIFIQYILVSHSSFSQVGIGTAEPSPSAMLEIQSTNRGLLLPRMNTSQQKNILEAEPGLVIYNLDSNDIYLYNGAIWIGILDVTDTIVWSCGDTLIDQRDLKFYATLQIGTQCWMAENLNTGTMISGFDNSQDNGLIEKFCYNNLESNCEIYGGLYQWIEMMQYITTPAPRGICPVHWHIPTDDEWKVLEGTVDSLFGVGNPVWNNFEWRGSDAGGNLKETGTTHWLSSNIGATNSSGFTALPAGYNAYGDFYNLGNNNLFWTSNQNNETLAYGRLLANYTAMIARYSDYTKAYGFSVRCLKD
jgi:uncharacterized protein (TIGR02145 family)